MGTSFGRRGVEGAGGHLKRLFSAAGLNEYSCMFPGWSSKVSMQSRQGKHSKQASSVGTIPQVPAV